MQWMCLNESSKIHLFGKGKWENIVCYVPQLLSTELAPFWRIFTRSKSPNYLVVLRIKITVANARSCQRDEFISTFHKTLIYINLIKMVGLNWLCRSIAIRPSCKICVYIKYIHTSVYIRHSFCVDARERNKNRGEKIPNLFMCCGSSEFHPSLLHEK